MYFNRLLVWITSGFLLHFTGHLWTFIVTLSMAELRDQPQVIGSSDPIIVALGDDAILPCHVEPHFDVQFLTVEWSKPDLKPDPTDHLSRVEYVHLYRDRQEVPDMKIRSYIRRTALFTDRLKAGNISLKIMNVTPEDEGRYRCFIPKLNSPVKDSIVQLVVEQRTVESRTTETPPHPRDDQTPDLDDDVDVKGGRHHLIPLITLLIILLVLGGGVSGYLLKNDKCRIKSPEV